MLLVALDAMMTRRLHSPKPTYSEPYDRHIITGNCGSLALRLDECEVGWEGLRMVLFT